MNYLYLFLSGILISVGAVLPGVSGTVIAIMLGIYEKVINLICLKGEYKKKIKEILPLTLGFILGLEIFGKILLEIYSKYESPLKYIFIGLILGSLPVLNNEIKSKNESLSIKYLMISLLISLIFFSLPNFVSEAVFKCDTNFKLMIAGFFYSMGKIIPGISSSIFMIAFGLYESILMFITNPFSFSIKEYIDFIPFIIGIIIGVLLLVKTINYLLNRHFSKTYSSIIGFVIGSLITLIPKFEPSLSHIFSILIMIFITLIGFYFNHQSVSK